jgi:hypothetical protein
MHLMLSDVCLGYGALPRTHHPVPANDLMQTQPLVLLVRAGAFTCWTRSGSGRFSPTEGARRGPAKIDPDQCHNA